MTAILGVAAAPASAERLPAGPGQPVFTGQVSGPDAHGVIHCQRYMEFLEGELPPGTYPGVMVLKPNGEYQYGGPPKRVCPLTEIFG